MKNYAVCNLKVILFISCIFVAYSSNAQKDNASGSSIQNLTARYNYIYNSKVILASHQQEIAESKTDNYDQLLPLYIGPEVDLSQANVSLNLKPMDDIIKKAQTIILDKSNSNYVDDAYILLGKANFYNGNYFNAAEYLDYAAKTYRGNIYSFIEALNWRARSLMQLRRIKEANQTLDTLEYIIPEIKKQSNLADPLATLAQMCIYLKNDTAAISYLKDAIKVSNKNQDKVRWTYVLAQLYEKHQDYNNALINYRKVIKSNAPFEMYFNANLSRIKILAQQDPRKINKQKSLLSLLKDDKNFDYNDQIYFHIAEAYVAEADYPQAEKYFNLSIQKSTNNTYQKGLSYLRVADLNFKQLKNYLKAKAYYDSTVNTLPKSHSDYELIVKKNQNLEYLTNRYDVIAIEDTLQSIAKLPETSRAAKILAMSTLQEIQPSVSVAKNSSNHLNYFSGTNRNQPQSSFYFSNPTAVSMGFSDFKKKWGNRKLENNWRQSIRTSALETTQDLIDSAGSNSVSGVAANTIHQNKDILIKKYTEDLPITPELLNKSNQKIIVAFYEIGSFYLQELNDPEEAEEVYKTLLNRFPKNDHLAAIYYSLFLIHKTTDAAKSSTYKEKLLKEFSTSTYAKVILDPSFSIRQSELDAVVNKQYNELFEQYLKKNFNNIMRQVDISMQQHPSNYLSPQFAYLKAISIGRTHHVDSLMSAFNTITTQFPEDKLITPLVRNHLIYINSNLEEFRKRAIALIDFDPNEPPFSAQQVASINQVKQHIPPLQSAPIASGTPTPITSVPVGNKSPDVLNPLTSQVKTDGLFTDANSTSHYYVLHVADASLTLSSSRFGIGQFNRGNYADSNLKHQLKEFDNDQLIYIGNFTNFDEVKTYASDISPQLKQIMKVPANIYSGFIISKENFDKISSKQLLDRYLEFYKNNY